MALIELKDVYKAFGKNEARVQALNGVSITVNQGKMVAVMGKSGSGKSTLLNIIGGLTKMDRGELIYQGKRLNLDSGSELIQYRRDKIGFIVQYFALIDDMTVFDNVALPLRYQKLSSKEIKARVILTLEELGINDKVKAYPNELSGGQQQRVAIARAIVKKPTLILADEPTGALDEGTQIEVISIFKKLHEQGKTIIIVTHDQKVADFCEEIIYLKDGRDVIEQ